MLVGDCGIVVPKENPQALAEGLGRLLAVSAGERRRMGLAAMERVRSGFTIESTRRRFEDVYRNLLEEVRR